MPQAADDEGAPPTGLALRERVIISVGSWILRALLSTMRVRIEGGEVLERLQREGRPFILCSWHGRVLLCMRPFAHLQPLLMISRSRDGERISRAVAPSGWRTVRGSSSRGGARALFGLIRHLRRGHVAGHVVDGPRGPAGEIKPGLMVLAQSAGAAIVPVLPAARWRWEAPSWDRMQVPLPFSRVLVRIQEPVLVPGDLPEEGVEGLRIDLERRFHRGFKELEQALRAR